LVLSGRDDLSEIHFYDHFRLLNVGFNTMFRHIESFARYFFGSPDPNFFEQVSSKIVTRNLKLLEGLEGLLLDDGCGFGYQTKHIASIGRFIPVGMDIFGPEVLIAKKSANYPLVIGDGCNLPFPSQSFDVVVSNQVIEHISNYDRYIEEAYRVLKIGGHLILSTENRDRIINLFITHLLKQKAVLRWSNVEGLPPEKFRGHTQEFTEQELRDLFQEHGFEIVKFTGFEPSRYQIKGIANWCYDMTKYITYQVISRVFNKTIYDNFCVLARKCID